MADNKTKGPAAPPADFVVVDRETLRQTLQAVVHTLKSAANLEQLRLQGGVDDTTYQELAGQLQQARESLAEGVQQIMDRLSDLPSVEIKPD